MSKDNLYQQKMDHIPGFRFDQPTADVFDDMAKRSIPFYHEMQSFIGKLTKAYYQPGTLIYDLGCSTGNTVAAIDRVMDQDYQLVAADLSREMIELAKQKNAHIENVQWLAQGIEDMAYENASIINVAYVLQFIEPNKRETVLRNIYAGLAKGGILILAEKIHSEDSKLNDLMIEQYYQFKQDQGYSQLEIRQKEQALKNTLRPFTVRQYEELLKNAGFTSCQSLFQYMNFVTWVIFK